MKTKVCSKCKQQKPLYDFCIDKKSKDGFGSHCKVCHALINKMYRDKNKDKIKEKLKEYYQTDRYRNTWQKYKQVHKEDVKKQNRKYNQQKRNCFVIWTEKELVENYRKAKADNFIGWHRHHRLETHNSDGVMRSVFITKEELIALDMYYQRPASELIWLPITEHSKLHKNEV